MAFFPLTSGYEGVFCHINTDECASQPCLNNGKCVDKINSFHCECPKGENVEVAEINKVKFKGGGGVIGCSELQSFQSVRLQKCGSLISAVNQ